MFRRATAVIVSLLVLQLSFAGTDLVCARHGVGHSGTISHSAEHLAHAIARQTHVSTSVDESKSCEIPAQHDCCAALTSCGPSIGLLTASRVSDVPLSVFRVAIPVAETPRSLTAAPEPPPPKA